MKTKLTLIAAALLLAGCANLAPPKERPPMPVPDHWNQAAAEDGAGEARRPAADIPWAEFFTEPRLARLIARALAHNRDLRVAALNIERARALHRIEQAALGPEVGVAVGALAQRTPAPLHPTGAATTSHRYDLGAGFAGWELDFFGRLRHLDEAALQGYLATRQARDAAQIALVAEVAGAWLALAAEQERLRLAADTLAGQQQALALVRHRVEAGVATRVDLLRAQTTVEAARADLARHTAQAAQTGNALALLVGAPVDAADLPESLAPAASLDLLPAGLPSQVLLRRPDIRQAEHRLLAGAAQVGAARAARFPQVTLTAGGGLASAALGELLKAGAGAWSLAPSVALPLFDGGRRRAAVDVARAEQGIALAEYEAAVQRAFREVADALALRATLGEQLAAQQALVEANADAHRLSQLRFREGTQSYLEVLDAQRELYGAKQALIAVRLTRLVNQVTLYKVLGGGWG